MNSVDMANALIFRAKNLQEFVIETDVPDEFVLNGVIPFDMEITEGIIKARVFGLDFNEAVNTFDNWLGSCK